MMDKSSVTHHSRAKDALQKVITQQLFKTFPDTYRLYFDAMINIQLDLGEIFTIDIRSSSEKEVQLATTVMQPIETEINISHTLVDTFEAIQSRRHTQSKEVTGNLIKVKNKLKQKKHKQPDETMEEEDSMHDYDDEYDSDNNDNANDDTLMIVKTEILDRSVSDLDDVADPISDYDDVAGEPIASDTTVVVDSVTVDEEHAKKCLNCSFETTLQKNLNRHMARAHPNLKCKFCGENMKTKKDFDEHIKTCEHQKKCPNCTFACTLQINLKRHIRRVHPCLKCKFCAEPMESDEVLVKHIKDHHSDQKIVCKHCSRTFHSLSGLSLHMVTHEDTNKNDIHCSYCNKICKNPGAARIHMSYMHPEKMQREDMGIIGKKDYKLLICDKCDFTSTDGVLFKRHIESSICHYCGHEFQCSKQFKAHQHESHPESRTKECQYCTKVYMSKNGFSAHMRLAHPEHIKKRQTKVDQTEGHVCDICGKEFPIYEYLKSHMRYHNQPNKWQCIKCEKQFTYRSGWKNHVQGCMNQYGYPCETCGKLYKNEYTLSLHVRQQHVVGGYPCRICRTPFTYRIQRNDHEKTCKGIVDHSDSLVTNVKLQEKYTKDYKQRFAKNHVYDESNIAPITFSDTKEEEMEEGEDENVETQQYEMEASQYIQERSQPTSNVPLSLDNLSYQ